MTSLCWHRILRLEDLEPGRPRVLLLEGRSLAVFACERQRPPTTPRARTTTSPAPGGISEAASGGLTHHELELHCVDNLCPRDGTALPRTIAKPCLTECHCELQLLEPRAREVGPSLRNEYPLRVRGEWIEVGLRHESADERHRRVARSLDRALERGLLPRAMRDVVELLHDGAREADVVRQLLDFDAAHGVYGSTDAGLLAIDMLRLVHEWPRTRFCLPLAPALEHLSHQHVRRRPRELATPGGYVDRVQLADALLALADRRELGPAEALLRSALAQGVGPATIESLMLRICARHFLDAGVALGAVQRIFEFLRRHGRRDEEILLCGLLRRVLTSPRVDASPGWGGFRQRIALLRDDDVGFPEESRQAATWSEEQFEARVLGTRAKDAFDAVFDAWRSGVPPSRIASGLVTAAAERMLRFDESIDRDITVQDGWLTVARRLTFAYQVFQAVERADAATALRLLLQCAHFVQEAGTLDGDAELWGYAPGLESGLSTERIATELTDAVRQRRGGEALHWGAAWLERQVEPFQLRVVLAEFLFDDHFHAPEHVTVATELLLAAMDLLAWFGDEPAGRMPVLAALRFFAADSRQRPLRRLAHESLRYVCDGRLPRCRT